MHKHAQPSCIHPKTLYNALMSNTSWYLQQIDLFEGISEAEIMSIAENATSKICAKKELIYTPFEISDSIGILKKGEVTLYNSHRGKRLIIDVLKPGSIFGNISFQEEPSNHFAEVTEDALICFIKLEDFKKIIQQKPELMIRLLKIMSDRLKDYENKLKSGLFDAKEKILHHLDLIERKNKKSLLGKLLPKKTITHELLSQHTGLSRETVTRALNDLKKEGLV